MASDNYAGEGKGAVLSHGFVCHLDWSRICLRRSGGINAKRFALCARAEMNRFALIPPLRALTGAPVGMTQKSRGL
jgi:hypothetical protein